MNNTITALSEQIKNLIGFDVKSGYGKTLEDMLQKSVAVKDTCFISFLSGTNTLSFENGYHNFNKNLVIYVRTTKDIEEFCENFIELFSGLRLTTDYGKYAINILQYNYNYDLDFELIEINIILEKV